MKHLKIQIRAKSPLCFSERRPSGQFRQSAGFVPGAVLRGAVATTMLRQGQEHTAAFRRLLGIGQSPAALFHHAYPGDCVLPHTALSCKDNPGFFGRSEQNHGVFDALIDRLCFEQLRPPGVLYLPRCPSPNCQPGRAESFAGFYSKQGAAYQERKIPQRLLTRVGINRQRMAAESELLYSPLVLSESWWGKEGNDLRIQYATFNGEVLVEDDLADDLTNALQQISHLGSGAARGLGQVKVTRLPKTNEDKEEDTQAVAQRIARFNAALHTRWEELSQLCGENLPARPQVFTVNLRSDAILKEKGWLSTMVLTAEMLCEAAGINDSSLRLLRSYASYDYRGGWSTGQRLPKDTELATRAGSVFVFCTDDTNRWLQPLADLEVFGVGGRTAEGFGAVLACDDFHVEGREAR